MAADPATQRKVKDAIRTRNTNLCDIIVNGDLTTIVNICEQNGIITEALKKNLTSAKTNKDDNERAFKLLDAVRSSLAFETSDVMDEFLCIIHQYGGPGGVQISQQIVQDCSSLNLPKYQQLATSPRRAITTKPIQEDLPPEEHPDHGEIAHIQPKQEMFESMPEVNDDDNADAVDQISLDSSSSVYTYPNKHRGLVLVICNEEWESDPSRKRDGSDADIKAIKETFEPLKYTVIVNKDMTSVQMKDYFKDLDTVFRMGFSPGDCFICFIMSHGNSFGIEGTDGHHVSVRTLAKYVQSDKCISLKGRPKLFFVQACRGQGLPNQVKLDSPAGAATENRIVTDSSVSAIPPEADFFFGYSTVCNNAALRGDHLGSHYIQALCNTISNNSKKLSLYDIVMNVHQALATNDKYMYQVPKTGTKYRQMAEMVSTLRGRFYFKH